MFSIIRVAVRNLVELEMQEARISAPSTFLHLSNFLWAYTSLGSTDFEEIHTEKKLWGELKDGGEWGF